MRVLVLGASGLFGSTLAPFLASRGHEVIQHGYRKGTGLQADLTDPHGAHNLCEAAEPEAIVNLVGLTDVDRCETHPNQAYRLNVRTVENVVRWIRQQARSCHFIHLSTDQVYDGLGPSAEDQVTLTNYYAFSKYAGELAAAGVPSTVLRTNFFGRSRCASRSSLSDWLFGSLSTASPIQVFDDVLFCPLSMATLSEMIDLSVLRKPVGVFNLGSHDGLSKADFAFAFARELKLSPHVMTRTTTARVDFLKTYRPKDMRMTCSKFEHAIGVKLPSLGAEIERAAREYCDAA